MPVYHSYRLILFGLLCLTAAQQIFCQPNILMILVDDLGYGDLSSYGAQDLQTPNIDNLISSGMRFDYFYANCNVCSPTRAALLTGRYPDLVGVPGVVRNIGADNSFGYFNPGAVTLPEVMKDAGYTTAIIGKWHLGLESPNLPNERGFDHLHGFLADMMNDYYTHERFGENWMRLNDQTINPTGHATDLFTQWAIDYIDSQTVDQPWFLYLAYNAPHTPIQPPQEWLDIVNQREPGLTDTRAKLVALIEHLDDGIGKVMDALNTSGLADNTLVVFSSDNGGQCNVGGNNGDLNGCKQDNLEGGIRVPTGIAWPGIIEAGSLSNRVAMTMDLFPTFCEAANARCNHEMEGRSIFPTLLGFNQPPEDRYLFWMRRGDRGSNNAPYYAARYGDDKICQDHRPSDPFALYNLADDPGEQNNLGQNNAVFDDLNSALQEHISLSDTVGWQTGSDPIVPRTITLLQPSGGEDWETGSEQTITWTSNSNLGNVKIEYSPGGGFLWMEITESVSFTDTGFFQWTLPDAAMDSVRVRVSSLDGNMRDFNPAYFKISLPDNIQNPGRQMAVSNFTIRIQRNSEYIELQFPIRVSVHFTVSDIHGKFRGRYMTDTQGKIQLQLETYPDGLYLLGINLPQGTLSKKLLL